MNEEGRLVFLVTFLSLIITGSTENTKNNKVVSYDGHTVLEIVPQNGQEVEWLKTQPCRSLTDWLGLNRPAHLLCSRRQGKDLKKSAKREGIKVKVISRNLGKEIKMEAETIDILDTPSKLSRNGIVRKRKRNKKRRNRNNKKKETVHNDDNVSNLIVKKNKRSTDGILNDEVKTFKPKNKPQIKSTFQHRSYLGSSLMYDWLQQLTDRFSMMKMENLAKTREGNDIKIIKINSDNNNLPVIFIDAGIHAREWISPAAVMFLTERLIKTIQRTTRKGEDSALNKFQWHIIPLANPDGYEYSRTKDRMWRKNTVNIPGSRCIGVDLNRNFPEGYGIGASRNPCSEAYQGPNPFSEPESRAIRDYIGNTSAIVGAVSVHSYGNVLIYPWGYKMEQHKSRAKLASMASSVSNAIKSETGETYTPGTSREVFGLWGLAGGATDDWYITQGIPYSYTFELPEKDNEGDHGFLLPARNIIKVGKQLVVGFTQMAESLSK